MWGALSSVCSKDSLEIWRFSQIWWIFHLNSAKLQVVPVELTFPIGRVSPPAELQTPIFMQNCRWILELFWPWMMLCFCIICIWLNLYNFLVSSLFPVPLKYSVVCSDNQIISVCIKHCSYDCSYRDSVGSQFAKKHCNFMLACRSNALQE